MRWITLCFIWSLVLFSCSIGQDSSIAPQKNDDLSDATPVRARRSAKLLPKAMTAQERQRARELIKNQPVLYSTYAAAPSGVIRVPAEYEPLEGVLVRIANDESMDDFFGNMIKGIIDAGAKPYLVYVDNSDQKELLQYALTPKNIASNQVQWVQSSIDAFWSRDYGPWHVYADGKRVIVDMRYYPTRPYDDDIPLKLGKMWPEKVYKAHFYVEGGNFMTDGKGTCWTSTGVLEFNDISIEQLSELYRKYLGCRKTYVPKPLYQEGTTHVDMYSKIINDETILVGYSTRNWGASNEEINSLDEAAKFYASNTNVFGKPFKVVRIPMYFRNYQHDRVYFAYTNATIVNKSVLVPLYNLPTDQDALQVYRDQMPGYNIVGIKGGQDVILWGGSVHCTTMQIPTAQTNDPGGNDPIVAEQHSDTLTQGEWKVYGPYLADAGDFAASLSGTGDADLYVWKDLEKHQITSSNFVCSPYTEDSSEQCLVPGPGTFYVGIYAASATSYALKIEYNKK
jgi:agmatine/peptidylarginine deiminase